MTKPMTLDEVKTIDQLGQFVGLKEGEGNAILKEVRENHAKLRGCARHQFKRPPQTQALFRGRFPCIHCGGQMSGEAITYYAEGVMHAGNPFDVWVK